MIVIPQRLFEDRQVKTILRDGNVCILKKELHQPLLQREGYISNHVVSILFEGKQVIQPFEGEAIEVEAGQVLFIPRGMYHITDLLPEEGVFSSLLFYFDDALIQDFLAQKRLNQVSKTDLPMHLVLDAVPAITLFATSLISIYQNITPQDKSFLNLKILELLHLLDRFVPDQEFSQLLFGLSLPKKRNIRSFMDQNFDKPLKVEDYAYLTGRSLSSFRRDFKSYFDTTPQKWLKDKRLEKALQLIGQKEMTVTELAYETGYENISYFIREFKQKVGHSPKQYMLELRQSANS